MTGQASDKVAYREEKYSLVGISGTGLFDPAAHGIKTLSTNTGCWRGFVCGYVVKENTLRLRKLTCGLDDKEPPPLLWGRAPQKEIGEYYRRKFVFFGKKIFYSSETGDYCYSELDALIEYTGGLLIGNSFIETMYVHQGFQKAYRYENVHELTFEKGALIAARDVSDAMAAYRREMRRRRREQGEPSKEEMNQWMADCYDQDYSKWFD